MRSPLFHEIDPAAEMSSGLRSAVRFPIRLPIRVIADDEIVDAESENVSANGILLRVDREIAEGTTVEFLVEIPGGMLGLEQTAAIHCSGRVVRTFVQGGRFYAAAVIEEYGFQ